MQRATRISSLPPPRVSGVITLDFDARQKHRFLARLEGGGELAIQLPRGSVLADGDILETDDGAGVRVRAAEEELSVLHTSDPLLFGRLAYHLGNRHVPLELGPGRIAYRHDHVLDDLATRLGAELSFERAPFSPEGGAYGRGESAQGHGHAHAHEAHAHDTERPPRPVYDTVRVPELEPIRDTSPDNTFDSEVEHDYGGEG
jgi:urease accessory protein